MIEQHPWLSLVPPITTILLAILSRKVKWSLGLGIVVGALLLADFNPLGALQSIWEAFAAQFWSDGAFDTYNLFILLIPIAGEIMLSLGADDLLIPALGAVLAGSVLGDHMSPISDTTILSSTGSQANIITHVKTQLPYALIAAAAAMVGYFVAAATGGVVAGLIATLIALALLVFIANRMTTALVDEIPHHEFEKMQRG